MNMTAIWGAEADQNVRTNSSTHAGLSIVVASSNLMPFIKIDAGTQVIVMPLYLGSGQLYKVCFCQKA